MEYYVVIKIMFFIPVENVEAHEKAIVNIIYNGA